MARSLDPPWMGKIEWQADFASDKFVCNGSIVDAVNGFKPYRFITIGQFIANRLERGNINYGNAKTLRSHMEVGKGLLKKWIDFSENDVLWGMAAEDCATEQIPIRPLVEASKKNARCEG